MPQEVPVRVFRYSAGGTPHYQSYRVSVPDEANVIDVLDAVWRQDPTLTYRHACHHASCGTCAVRLNGYEKLPCIVPVRQALAEGNGVLLLEPLRHFPLVSDLVVDVAGFFQKLAAAGMRTLQDAEPVLAGSRYQPSELYAEPGQWVARAYGRLANCIECGICLSACPTLAASDRFLGPAPLAALHQALPQADEAERSLLLALADGEQGVWRCHSAWECTEACPQDVRPAEAIMALRRELVGQKLKRLLGNA